MKVLVIDDELLFAEYLQDLLLDTFENVEVVVSGNGFEAGIQLRDFKPDIVLLDLNMPGFDGYSVCQQIKLDEVSKNIFVIAITGDGRSDVLQRVKSAGADGCLAKPINSKELIGLIEKFDF